MKPLHYTLHLILNESPECRLAGYWMDSLKEKQYTAIVLNFTQPLKPENAKYISENAYRDAVVFIEMEQSIQYLVYPLLQQLVTRQVKYVLVGIYVGYLSLI